MHCSLHNAQKYDPSTHKSDASRVDFTRLDFVDFTGVDARPAMIKLKPPSVLLNNWRTNFVRQILSGTGIILNGLCLLKSVEQFGHLSFLQLTGLTKMASFHTHVMENNRSQSWNLLDNA